MAVDWKQRAIEQWTDAPCGPNGESTPASELLIAKRAYAPWLPAALDYANTTGLDVLDVGCGQGADVCEYALAGARATGVDLTPRHLELAREHVSELGLEASIVEADAESLPFDDATFDRVSSNGVLHHTPDMPAALREIHRVLRPRGLATVIVYNRNSWHFWLQQVVFHGLLQGQLFRTRGSIASLLSENVEVGNGRPLVRVYTQRQVKRMMEAAGFRNVETSTSPMRPGETSLRLRLPGNGWYVIARGVR